MRKLLILLLLVSFCGGSSETVSVEDTTTTSSSSTSTSTSTTSSSTTTSSTTTTTKVPQAPVMRLDLCSDELNPTETENWAYEVEITNFNSKIKAIEYILYFNEEEVGKERESFIVNENQNKYYGLQAPIALTENGYNLKVKTTVFTVDDLETEIVCETRVLGAKELNISASSDTTTTTTLTTTTTVYTPLFPETPDSSTWVRFSGSGDDIVDVSSIGDELQILYIQATGDYTFYAYSLDANLDNESLIVAHYGNLSDVYLVNYSSYSNIERTVYVEISSGHSWELIFKPIASARNFESDVIEGIGDDVIEAYTLRDNNNIISITHNGDSPFYLYGFDCSGENLGLIVAENGSFTGNYRTDKGTCFLEVTSNGTWSISK